MRSGRILVLVLVIAAAVPLRAPLPTGVADNNWLFVVDYARIEGRDFGSGLTFTYGPWAFLANPLALAPWMVLAAGLFCGLSLASFWIVAERCLGRAMPAPAAIALASLVTVLASAYVTPSLLALGALTMWVLAALEFRARPATAALMSACFVSSLMIFIKVSEGIIALALCTLLVLSTRSWRTAVIAAATWSASLVAWWLLAGQELTNLGDYARASLDLVAGYGSAMSYEPQGRAPLMIGLALAAAAVVAFAAADYRAVERRPWIYWVTLALLLVLMVKQSFVRSDVFHHVAFYFLVVTVVIASVRRPGWNLAMTAAPAAVALTLLSVLGSQMVPTPKQGSTWEHAFRTVSSPQYLEARQQERRRSLRAHFAVGEDLVRRLGERPVFIEPNNATVSWAYGLRMVPLPTVEPYSAYTAALDKLNRAALLRVEGARILRRRGIGVIDHRQQLWDSPRYNVALVCRFDEVATSGDWSLLEPRASSRCGKTRVVGTKRLVAGNPIRLPESRPDEILVMRLKVTAPTLSARALGGLLAPQQLEVTLDRQRFRVPLRHASGPLLAALPQGLLGLTGADLPDAQWLTASQNGVVTFGLIDVLGASGDS